MKLEKRKKIICIDRESNPDRPRGRRAFYHWTIDAYLQTENTLFYIILQKINLVVYNGGKGLRTENQGVFVKF